MAKKRRNLTGLEGQTFGKWSVLHLLPRDHHRMKRKYYLCQCTCGTKRPVYAVNLINGHSVSCGGTGCTARSSSQRKGFGGITGSVWYVIHDNAKRRDMDFTITIEQAWRTFQRQKGRCALTGMELVLGRTVADGSASLDRIDSSRGYTPRNIQWLHKHINIMKNSHGEAYFIELCQRVADHNATSVIGTASS